MACPVIDYGNMNIFFLVFPITAMFSSNFFLISAKTGQVGSFVCILWNALKIICSIFCFDCAIYLPVDSPVNKQYSFTIFSVLFFAGCRLLFVCVCRYVCCLLHKCTQALIFTLQFSYKIHTQRPSD